MEILPPQVEIEVFGGRAVWRPHPEVVARRLGPELVLVHLGTDNIYRLDPIGTRLWELLAAGHDLGGIRRQMSQEFEVQEAQLRRDIDALLRLLLTENLVCAHDPA